MCDKLNHIYTPYTGSSILIQCLDFYQAQKYVIQIDIFFIAGKTVVLLLNSMSNPNFLWDTSDFSSKVVINIVQIKMSSICKQHGFAKIRHRYDGIDVIVNYDPITRLRRIFQAILQYGQEQFEVNRIIFSHRKTIFGDFHYFKSTCIFHL